MGTKKETKIEVVLDANIWLSLLMSKRLTESFAPILNNKQNRFIIYMLGQMLSELGRTLTYPKIAEILSKSKVDQRSALTSVLRQVSLRTIAEGKTDAIKADEPDNLILECAIDSNSNYNVSGDSHLLSLKEFKGVKIVTPAQSLIEIYHKKN